MPGGKRLYNQQQIQQLFNHNNEPGEQNNTKTKVCYARVSSHHQAEDLQRQISDIGSGLNFKRKGFTTLLERVYSSEICEVVVMHRDRLCRYGIEFVQWLFNKKQVRLLVHGQSETSETRELADESVKSWYQGLNNLDQGFQYNQM